MSEFDTIRRQAEAQGWVVEPTKSGHYKWFPPVADHAPIYSGSTSSDRRAIHRHRSLLRQAGFKDRGARDH